MAAMCGAWLRKNVPQLCPQIGSSDCPCTWRRSTEPATRPSFGRFHHGCAAHPTNKFSARIRRIKARKSPLICGRPPRVPRFPPPIATKSGTMPAHQRLWPNDLDRLEDRRKPTIQLDEEQAIVVGEPDPTAHLALQHSQLLPERGILCFKSALGLEERGRLS